MKFKKKYQREEKTLDPIVYVVENLQGYRNALIQSEVDSLHELSMVRHSFGSVLQDSEDLRGSLQDYEETFSNINTVSSQSGTGRSGDAEKQFPSGRKPFYRNAEYLRDIPAFLK